jgi:predicted nucleotidyltransferase
MDQRAAFRIAKKYIAYLKKNRIAVEKAYIFGSYASGNFNEDSDIDLAVILKNLSNNFLMQVELMKLGRKIDTRIEPHPIDESDFNSSNPFANEIITKGIQVI